MPTVHFDTKVIYKPEEQHEKRSMPPSMQPGNPVNPAWLPNQGAVLAGPEYMTTPEATTAATAYTLANCNMYITPACLRALYGLPNGTLAGSSHAIVEYTPQAFLQTDLDLFYATLQPNVPQGTAPVLNSIDGGVVQTTTQGFASNGESDLDIEYAQALVQLYQVGDLVEGASFNNLLEALDATYCVPGGENPMFDGVYPDTAAGGFNGHDCGTVTPASVISTSYGANEASFPLAYTRRQCAEYMKLGMAGVTVLYSSGDFGVAGQGGLCCANPMCAGGTFLTAAGSGTFSRSFPGTCPYVTSVGATQTVPGASVTAPEEACETVIFSGGGFSNQFAMPTYHVLFCGPSAAVHGNPVQQFSGRTSYPDISANGANYVVVVDGNATLLFGTSASSPTMGSVITLINEQRVSAGKAPVGFINPALYANAGTNVFNDITAGGNQGCGTAGLTAVPGWDPVTGLGTPNFPNMLAAFMALP
ncbi:hypothetical protein MMC13_001494 [Lambiella insularis]|nr:hypothetical protein [Lambiella insularis]